MLFTKRELEIMAVLWEHGPSTIAEVRGHLGADLSHNTVATLMGILEEKGCVAHATEGRAFRYRPLVAREAAATSAFSRLVDTVFAGSAEALLSHFARDRRLTRAELKRIRDVIDERVEHETKRPRRSGRAS